MSLYRVTEAFDAHAAAELVAGDVTYLRVLSLDESAFRRMFRYHTVLSDPEAGVLLDPVEGRSQASAERALGRLPAAQRVAIETVVVDCF